jgi:PadR family transcriptional regulator, regulatory protein PadR
MSACYSAAVDQPFQDLDLTPKMADVVRVFLGDPSEPRYGFELMRITGQPSGTLYPNLAKLEKHGWLILGKENIDPKIEGRPARRFYKISGAAVPAARLQLAALSERYRVAALRLRPSAEGGSL